MIRYALALLLVAAPAQAEQVFNWTPREYWGTKDDKGLKHIGTGIAAGAALDSLCVEASRRVYGGPNSPQCAAFTLLAGSTFYVLKERRDTQIYGRKPSGFPISGRDVAEGAGGMLGGVTVMTVLVGW